MRVICFLFACIAWASAGELRVVSYNIHHGRGLDGKLDLKRIAEVIRKGKPDLVALQEVDVNVPRSGKVDEAKKLGELLGMNHAFGKCIDLQGGEYGLAVLSKFPIEKTMIHKLPGPGEARIVFEAIITAGKKKISFASVHLDHRQGATRMLQVKAMDEALLQRKHPVIVAGDFNATPQSKTMKQVAATWSIVPKEGPALTSPANVPRSEIDYIITRHLPKKGATSKVIEEKVASDHRPVSGTVSIP